MCNGEGWVSVVRGLEVTDVEYELVDHEIVGLECGWDYEAPGTCEDCVTEEDEKVKLVKTCEQSGTFPHVSE